MTPQGLGWRAPRPVPSTIETPRLTLRLVRLDEIARCSRVVAANTAHLLPWMPWARLGEAGAARYYSEQLTNASSDEPLRELGLGIFVRESGRFIGATGIHDVRAETASAETGYWIAHDQTRLGYATEACRHVLSWALRPQDRGGLGLRRIRIYCSSANPASAHIPEALGLTAEVRQRRDYFVEGHGPTDRLGWGVLAEEWDCQANAVTQSEASTE